MIPRPVSPVAGTSSHYVRRQRLSSHTPAHRAAGHAGDRTCHQRFLHQALPPLWPEFQNRIRLTGTLSGLDSITMHVGRPVFGYLADRFRILQEPRDGRPLPRTAPAQIDQTRYEAHEHTPFMEFAKRHSPASSGARLSRASDARTRCSWSSRSDTPKTCERRDASTRARHLTPADLFAMVRCTLLSGYGQRLSADRTSQGVTCHRQVLPGK
jgi:hypothetical protein